jgi:hypothetical protein
METPRELAVCLGAPGSYSCPLAWFENVNNKSERDDMGDRRQDTRAAACLLLGLSTALGGCAFTYTDANGDRHAVGLLDVTVRAPAAPETFAGDVVEVTSLGLSIGQTAQGGYLTAGFNRETTAALRDNALVLGNPVTALSATRRILGEEK